MSGACRSFPSRNITNYDFESYFLALLPLLVSTPEQEEQFFALLDRQIEQEKKKQWSDYGVTQLIKAKIRYLRAEERDQEVLELLETHSRYYDFRVQLADRALEHDDFESAKKLCNEGIEIAKKENHHGIITRWQEKLFQIAKLENDVPEMRKWAETLFFNGKSMEWYRALKATYAEEEWPEKCEGIIKELKKAKLASFRSNPNTLARIYVEENYTDRLLKLLKQNSRDISFIDHYAEALREEYPYELLDLYEQGIRNFAQQTGRKNYRQVAGWLGKMKKITGGDERAYSLFKKLLRQYNNRPAMRDEFEKAFPKWKE
ncbi:MAG: hypothetical protein U5K69_26455 [Balneolaceae bacterium]|nr:hypothetical protein [Balneolaceae bacterium]